MGFASPVLGGSTGRQDNVPDRVAIDVKKPLNKVQKISFAPFIHYRKVFTFVPYANSENWTLLVRSLRQRGNNTKIAILSGLHGLQQGLLEGGHGKLKIHTSSSPGIVSQEEYDDDVKMLNSSLAKKCGYLPFKAYYDNVEVHKHWTSASNATYAGLKQKTLDLIDDGFLVVWNWCHSINSNNTYRSNPTRASEKWYNVFNTNKISTFVPSKFNWLPS